MAFSVSLVLVESSLTALAARIILAESFPAALAPWQVPAGLELNANL